MSNGGIVYKSILFVPPTPGSGLLKEVKQREKELNGHSKERIKMVEKGGIKIGQILKKKKPFNEDKCTDEWCPICKGDFGDIKMACNTNNVGYRWVCNTCAKTKNLTKA